MKATLSIFLPIVSVLLPALHLPAQDDFPNPDTSIRHLSEFGPLKDPMQAQQTWQAAREAMADEPGILDLPHTASCHNQQPETGDRHSSSTKNGTSSAEVPLGAPRARRAFSTGIC